METNRDLNVKVSLTLADGVRSEELKRDVCLPEEGDNKDLALLGRAFAHLILEMSALNPDRESVSYLSLLTVGGVLNELWPHITPKHRLHFFNSLHLLEGGK